MPQSEPPIGPVADATPGLGPGPVKLEGRYCRVEKLEPAAMPTRFGTR